MVNHNRTTLALLLLTGCAIDPQVSTPTRTPTPPARPPGVSEELLIRNATMGNALMLCLQRNHVAANAVYEDVVKEQNDYARRACVVEAALASCLDGQEWHGLEAHYAFNQTNCDEVRARLNQRVSRSVGHVRTHGARGE